MNRRVFISAATAASTFASLKGALPGKGRTRLQQFRDRFGIEGPIVLQGSFYQGFCPVKLCSTTKVRRPLYQNSYDRIFSDRVTPMMVRTVLQAVFLDRFGDLAEARKRFHLSFTRPHSCRSNFILGRDNAWAFQKKLSEWCDEIRLDLPRKEDCRNQAIVPCCPAKR